MRLGDKDFKSGWEVRRKCRLIGGEDIKTPLQMRMQGEFYQIIIEKDENF